MPRAYALGSFCVPTVSSSPWTCASEQLPPEEVIFGQSPQMRAVRVKIEKIATASAPVLIRGASGTGKETIAKLIHRWSDRSNGPFVKVNCPAIPEALLESELFGYEKAAFTGAFDTKVGLVEHAHGGTLLLDEIAELSVRMQAKLLELLQSGHFSRLGGGESKKVDARIECTTSRTLEKEVSAGTFREDLFYRVNVMAIEMPSLRDRRQDIPILVEYFRNRFNREYGRNTAAISNRTLKLLLEHRWPGNIRELENLVKRYVVFESEETIVEELLGVELTNFTVQLNGSNESVSLKSLTRQAVRDLERRIILHVLHANNWNRKEAARVLKVSYRGLFYKIKNAGVPGKKQKATPVERSAAEETL